jgi:ADP-ribose pyrophosphatase
MTVRTLDSKSVYKGRIFEVKKDFIRDGKSEYTRDIITHPGSTVMIPVVDPKKGVIMMIRQYRHAAGGIIIEFPAGTREKGESFLRCAKRELVEETGFSAKNVIKASKFFLAPGTMTEQMGLFICSKLVKKEQHLDSDEKIDVFTTTVKKAVDMVLSGAIRDAKTIAGVMLLEHIFRDKNLFKKYFPG